MIGSIKGRIFLVGCPRSGTTLLQSMLAAHPQIASFPETHFFGSASRSFRGKLMMRLGITPPEMRLQFADFLRYIGEESLLDRIPERACSIGQYTGYAVAILDDITRRREKVIWLEKSPEHVRYLPFIERYLSGAKIIHLLRNGIDVVASLHIVSNEFPELWRGAFDLDKCIARWNEDVQISLRQKGKKNHILVRYESIVSDPNVELKNICRFIGVEMQEEMLLKYRETAESLIREDEVWKKQVMEPIITNSSDKYRDIFSESQIEYVKKRLLELPADI